MMTGEVDELSPALAGSQVRCVQHESRGDAALQSLRRPHPDLAAPIARTSVFAYVEPDRSRFVLCLRAHAEGCGRRQTLAVRSSRSEWPARHLGVRIAPHARQRRRRIAPCAGHVLPKDTPMDHIGSARSRPDAGPGLPVIGSASRAHLPLGSLLALSPPSSPGIIQAVRSDRTELRNGESVNIHFRLSTQAKAAVRIPSSDLDAVRTYETASIDAGSHAILWDGKDSSGAPVPPESHAWTIEARISGTAEIWEPASLYSRPIEHLQSHQWDPRSRTLWYHTPVPMRLWVRAGMRRARSWQRS